MVSIRPGLAPRGHVSDFSRFRLWMSERPHDNISGCLVCQNPSWTRSAKAQIMKSSPRPEVNDDPSPAAARQAPETSREVLTIIHDALRQEEELVEVTLKGKINETMPWRLLTIRPVQLRGQVLRQFSFFSQVQMHCKFRAAWRSFCVIMPLLTCSQYL